MKAHKTPAYIIFIRIVDLTAWGLIIAAMVLISEARPEQENILHFFYGKSVRHSWLSSYINAAYGLLIACIAITAIGLIVNLIIHFRNNKCHISKGMAMGLVVSMLMTWLVSSNLL